ncbi:importin-4-like [Phlebotomus papatasi]|uniref:importin-4-like n=1 Tax=Phlebotomus papatasi TaxID=29031 RepID=UPI0024844B4C|nr:importin-4-like [Phlebotomus papatasi]
MEQLVLNLLSGDNDVMKKATHDLQEAFKRPETVPAFCDLIVSSANPQVRQYSAVLLRKRLAKLRNWQVLPQETREMIKKGILGRVVMEPERAVRNSIVQFIGVIVRHEFAKQDPWMNDVLKFIYDNCSANDANLSEIGANTLNVLTDVAPDQFVPHLEAISGMFSAALAANESSGTLASPVIFNILVALGNLVSCSLENGQSKNVYQNLVPNITKALHAFQSDPDQFVRAFEILENIAESMPSVLSAHLKLLLDYSLMVASSQPLDESVRVQGITFLGMIVRLKKKAVIKMKMIEPIIQVLFHLMASTPAGEDDEEEYFVGSTELSSPMTCATQTMDILALNVPAEKLIPPLLALLEPALAGSEPLPKKAAYLCIAVIAEGCAETICNKYLPPLLGCVKQGITDGNPLVRNAALFALGQFAEHLQPEISKYGDEILPILFEFLHQLCAQLRVEGKEPQHIDRMFYALETFCENLEDAIVPHLPLLMERLFESLNPSYSVHLRELSLSAISAAATAAKSEMLPYFQQIIQILKPYLVKTDDEDIKALRPQAIDTLAALARTIGKENFLPLSSDAMNFGLALLEDCKEPDLKRACYNLFASLAEVLNQDVAQALPQIITAMIESVKSTEGLVPDFDDDDEENGDIYNVENEIEEKDDDIDIETSDNEEDDDDVAIAVENAFMDEKEEAIIALRELALHSGAAFGPYLQAAFEEVYKLINYPQDDIRRVSVEALTQFTVSFYQMKNADAVRTSVTILIPKLSEIIRTDEERNVVMAALEAFNELLDKLKGDTFSLDDQKDAIFECVMDVMLGKVACQFDEVSNDDEEGDSEFDEAIIETAGEIVPRFGKALRPEEFAPYFGRAYTHLLEKLEKAKRKEEADLERAYVIGVLAECFEGLQKHTNTWMASLMPLLMSGAQERNDQIRNNSVFGLGELVLAAGEFAYDFYPQILQLLSAAVAKEQDSNTLDNICGALARLIIANSSLVPLKDVLPVFVQYLPLRTDFDENLAVFKCLNVAYHQGQQVLVDLMEHIAFVALQVLQKKEYSSDETRDYIFNFVQQIRRDFPEQYGKVVTNNPEIAAFAATF